jgi:hypothetical protein
VFLPSLIEEQDAIQIYEHNVAQQRMEYTNKDPLECGKGIGEGKHNHHPFIEPKYGVNFFFPSVGSSHVHLVIAHCEIHICQILLPFELINKVFDTREGIEIFCSNLVERMVISD